MIDYMKRFKLDDQVVVVCGGLGQIGLEVTHACHKLGGKVIVLDNDKEKGEKFAKDNPEIHFMYFDLTKVELYDGVISDIETKFGKINSWITTAYPRTKDWGNKLEDVSIESWRKNVDIHMNTYCFLTKKVAENMIKNKIKGSIVKYGSTYGVVAPDFEVYAGTDMTSPAAYNAIKGGIVNFVRYAASYYGKNGIRVNCLCPGGIFNNQKESFVKEYELRVPLKRMGSPDEIASATAFLVSDAASYITGTVFMVDGGWTCK